MARFTEIGHCTTEDIFIRDLNLADDIIGKFDFIDIIYYTLYGRKPNDSEKRMLNAILIVTNDHGLTPSSISTRLTYLGAPESIQGAIAAGLLGAGNHFLGAMQTSAELLRENITGLEGDSADEKFLAAADSIIDGRKAEGKPITGVGHPIHVNGDPRTGKLRELSRECGFYGRHWRLMDAIGLQLKARGKQLPINAVGAIAATILDMGLEPRIGRGLAIIGRAGGLFAHVCEEAERPVGQEIWNCVMKADAGASAS